MGIKTFSHTQPIVKTLLPVTFFSFPELKEKLKGCLYETIEEMKEAVTKVIDTLKQEDFHRAQMIWNHKCHNKKPR